VGEIIIVRKLDITNFGPIRSATINFEGLVVLQGPHGVGKSMIMEALLLSKYGRLGRVRR